MSNFCTECGNKLQRGDIFCVDCGTKTDEENSVLITNTVSTDGRSAVRADSNDTSQSYPQPKETQAVSHHFQGKKNEIYSKPPLSPLYWIIYLAGSIISIVLAYLDWPLYAQTPVGIISSLSIMSWFLQIVTWACLAMFIFKMWFLLNSMSYGINPWKASLLLFVPIFNIYWTFRVYVGSVRHYNLHYGNINGLAMSTAIPIGASCLIAISLAYSIVMAPVIGFAGLPPQESIFYISDILGIGEVAASTVFIKFMTDRINSLY